MPEHTVSELGMNKVSERVLLSHSFATGKTLATNTKSITMVSVSPSKSHNKSPLLGAADDAGLACNKAEKAAFDLGPWKSDFDEFLTLQMNRGRCGDIHHVQRVTTCNCMQELQTTLSYDDQSQVVDYLVQYAKLDWGAAMPIDSGMEEVWGCNAIDVGRAETQ